MITEQEGSFRIRTAGDGSLEVWARGWRLESQLYALIPMALSLMFLVAPMSMTMRVVGAVVMLAATLFVFRMTKPGLRLTEDAVSIISVVRTQRFPWEQVTGFMGERRHDEGRVHLILADERHVPLPGTLDPAELDPYGDEGALLSAADQLNLFKARAVSGDISKPAVPTVHASPPLSDHPTKREQRHERKALRAALKSVRPAPEGTPEPARVALDPPMDHPSRKARRSERKALRAALKAVQLTPEGEVAPVITSDDEQVPSRRLGRRSREEPVPELTEVTIGGGEPLPVAVPPGVIEEPTTGPASHYPTPVYIPQAEYARMLREQKAAEKAAVAAAAELRRLAESGELDELASKQEFSDWTS